MKKRYILMAVTAALVFAVAAGGTMAANRVVTDDIADVATPLASYDLEIGLTEGTEGVPATPGTPLTAADEDFEPFTASNAGTVPAYVRVTITKYWETAGGDILPADNVTIDYGAGEDKWVQGAASLFDEGENPDTVIFYHKAPIEGGQPAAGTLVQTITIDGEATNNAYADATLHVEAVAEGVQFAGADNNDVNQNAILAAWGVQATLTADGAIETVAWPN